MLKYAKFSPFVILVSPVNFHFFVVTIILKLSLNEWHTSMFQERNTRCVLENKFYRPIFHNAVENKIR